MIFPPHLLATGLAVIFAAGAPKGPDAPTLATLYGRALGAAGECNTISHDRTESAARKAAEHLKQVSTSDNETTAAGIKLSDAIAEGRRAVRNGIETCAQAESELANLEHDLAR